MDGRIEIIENNNAANPVDTTGTSPLWKPVLADGKPASFVAEDGEIRLTNNDNSGDWSGCAWRDLQVDIETPEILKALALHPSGIEDNESCLYTDGDKERLAVRGGRWDDGTGAGVFALALGALRSDVHTRVGFRAAFNAPPCTPETA
jgi:hypothetical protein